MFFYSDFGQTQLWNSGPRSHTSHLFSCFFFYIQFFAVSYIKAVWGMKKKEWASKRTLNNVWWWSICTGFASKQILLLPCSFTFLVHWCHSKIRQKATGHLGKPWKNCSTVKMDLRKEETKETSRLRCGCLRKIYI